MVNDIFNVRWEDRHHDRRGATAVGGPASYPQRLAHQVPARDVERGQGRLGDLAGPPVLGPLDVPGQPFDVERIAADDIARRQLAEAGEQGLGLVDHPYLADTDQPVIGHQLDECQLPPGRTDDSRHKFDNLHCRILRGRDRRMSSCLITSSMRSAVSRMCTTMASLAASGEPLRNASRMRACAAIAFSRPSRAPDEARRTSNSKSTSGSNSAVTNGFPAAAMMMPWNSRSASVNPSTSSRYHHGGGRK